MFREEHVLGHHQEPSAKWQVGVRAVNTCNVGSELVSWSIESINQRFHTSSVNLL